MAQFLAIHPVLPARDVSEAIRFYIEKLGFTLQFQDTETDPHYAGVKRDEIEIHLQWHDENEFHTVDKTSLRFVIKDVDSLFEEFRDKDLEGINEKPEKTAWGTYEFSFFDPNSNGLFFYSDL